MLYNAGVTGQAMEKIYASLRGRDSAFRAYVLTMDSSYLKPRDSLKSVGEQLSILDSLMDENEIQKQHVKKLKDYIQAQNSISLKAKDPRYLESAAFQADLKTELMRLDSIKAIILAMKKIESALVVSRDLNAQKHTVIATMVGVAVGIFSIIIFIVAFYFVDLELRRSQHHSYQMQRLNTKIAEVNKELEEANRNLQKLNSELEDKNIQLEKNAKELSSFTHITSHDMQEPLRKIEFFISVVEDREKQNLSEEGKKFLEKIKKSVSRMRQLFLGMLDFSLINSVGNTFEEIDLNDVLHEILGLLKADIKDTHSIIKADALPKVKGIKYQLIQLFENIVSNAIQFRRNGVTPEIRITAELIHSDSHTLPPGLQNNSSYYKIDFRDNGIGFDEEHAERIFEIFQRLNPKSGGYGVGVGLAVCRRIAANHNAILVVKSQPGAGSVFSLYIPAIS